MKKLIFILCLIPFIVKAQTYSDIIITDSEDTIYCLIMSCDATIITYEIKVNGKQILENRALSQIISFVNNGNLVYIKKYDNNIDTNIVEDKEVDIRPDPESKRMNLIENRIAETQYYLAKSHKQFKKGTILLISGVLISGIGSGVYLYLNYKYQIGLNATNSNHSSNTPPSMLFPIISGIGSLISFVGIIVQIDSHKYIGRASLGTSLDGITLNFKF